MEINVKIDDAEVLRNMAKLGGKFKPAIAAGLRDTIIATTADVVKGSRHKTGNNQRSIAYESDKLSAAVFSTSGYGGYLETGTAKMAGIPYFKPALDKNMPDLGKNIKRHM